MGYFDWFLSSLLLVPVSALQGLLRSAEKSCEVFIVNVLMHIQHRILVAVAIYSNKREVLSLKREDNCG